MLDCVSLDLISSKDLADYLASKVEGLMEFASKELLDHLVAFANKELLDQLASNKELVGHPYL